MSKYTTEVRYICENIVELDESVGFNDIDNVLTAQNVALIMSGINYPIFDENYRYALNKKILEHFYTREIGLETVGLWKFKMRTKLNEIMPYYNQLYRSELLQFNPFYDVDLMKSSNKSNESNSKTDNVNDVTADRNANASKGTTSNSKVTSEQDGTSDTASASSSDKLRKYADTPQGGLSGLESGTYLTNATKDSGTGNSTEKANSHSESNSDNEFNESVAESTTGTSKEKGVFSGATDISSTEAYIEHIKGKQSSQSYSARLIEFRETMLNIDMQVIEELEDLFMKLW